MQHAFTQITRNIKVTVTPEFIESQSAPSNQYFVWSYNINIVNLSATSVQLTNRHWKVIDANGKHEQVSGEGVVGIQPHIYPGESFEYSSGTHLFTPYGVMMGRYTMQDHLGEIFDVVVPTFSLNCIHNKTLMH